MAPKSNFSKGAQIKCGDKEWILENYINCGSFGELWVGRFSCGPKKGLKVAVKFETLVDKDGNENMKPQLPLEWAFYKKLVNEESNFVPEIQLLQSTQDNLSLFGDAVFGEITRVTIIQVWWQVFPQDNPPTGYQDNQLYRVCS